MVFFIDSNTSKESDPFFKKTIPCLSRISETRSYLNFQNSLYFGFCTLLFTFSYLIAVVHILWASYFKGTKPIIRSNFLQNIQYGNKFLNQSSWCVLYKQIFGWPINWKSKYFISFICLLPSNSPLISVTEFVFPFLS